MTREATFFSGRRLQMLQSEVSDLLLGKVSISVVGGDRGLFFFCFAHQVPPFLCQTHSHTWDCHCFSFEGASVGGNSGGVHR